jgi:peroxiredoxin
MNSVQNYMHRYFFFLIFLFLAIESFAQNDAIAIIKKSLNISAQIKNGTYDAHLRIKYLSDNDTNAINGTCRFQRYTSDTLVGAKFELTANDVRVLYDGRNKTTIYPKDNFAIVHDRWKYKLKLSGSIYHLLSAYVVNGRTDINEVIKAPATQIQLMKDTIIDNTLCYHISIHPEDNDNAQNIYRQFFISKDNNFLKGETLNLDAHNHHQFTELFLHNVKTNITGLDVDFGTGLIPKDFYIKDYIPDELSKLLSAGTIAPNFELSGLDGKKYALNNLKGKIVVLYFWSAIDQQSRVRLMPLQKIYEKYKSNDVEVMGMNVSDTDKEHLKLLLQNKKITFPQLMNAAITGEKYNIVNLPTIYVIGKDGKVIQGFIPAAKENLELKIEDLILKNK